MFLETPRGNLLFDTGMGWSLLHNASELNIDLSSVDQVVLSHGHYDHTWGLNQLLLRRGSIPVWAHDKFDSPHYSFRNMKRNYIGSSLDRTRLDLKLVEGITEITENVWAITLEEGERDPELLPVDSKLVIPGKDGTLEQDPILDDLSLLIRGSKGYTVILGCAHAGVVNILEKASRITGAREFYSVIGGMHMVSQSTLFIDRTVQALTGSFSVTKWRPNHCTGFKAALSLGKIVEDIEWACSGNTMEL